MVPLTLLKSIKKAEESAKIKLFLKLADEKTRKEIVTAEQILQKQKLLRPDESVLNHKDYLTEEEKAFLKRNYGLIKYLSFFSPEEESEKLLSGKKFTYVGRMGLKRSEIQNSWHLFFGNFHPVLFLFSKNPFSGVGRFSDYSDSYREFFYTLVWYEELFLNDVEISPKEVMSVIGKYEEFINLVKTFKTEDPYQTAILKKAGEYASLRTFALAVFGYVYGLFSKEEYKKMVNTIFEIMNDDFIYVYNFLEYHSLQNPFFSNELLINETLKQAKYRYENILTDIRTRIKDSFLDFVPEKGKNAQTGTPVYRLCKIIEKNTELKNQIEEITNPEFFKKGSFTEEEYSKLKNFINYYLFNENHRNENLKSFFLKAVLIIADGVCSGKTGKYIIEENRKNEIPKYSKNDFPYILSFQRTIDFNNEYNFLKAENILNIFWDVLDEFYPWSPYGEKSFGGVETFKKGLEILNETPIENKSLLAYLLSFSFLFKNIYFGKIKEETMESVKNVLKNINEEEYVGFMEKHKNIVTLFFNISFYKISLFFNKDNNENIKRVKTNLKLIRKTINGEKDSFIKEMFYFNCFISVLSKPTRHHKAGKEQGLSKNGMFFKTILNEWKGILEDYYEFVKELYKNDKFTSFRYGYVFSLFRDYFFKEKNITEIGYYIERIAESTGKNEFEYTLKYLIFVFELFHYRGVPLTLKEFYNYFMYAAVFIFSVQKNSCTFFKGVEKHVNFFVKEFSKMGFPLYFIYFMTAVLEKQTMEKIVKDEINYNSYIAEKHLSRLKDIKFFYHSYVPLSTYVSMSREFCLYLVEEVIKNYRKEEYAPNGPVREPESNGFWFTLVLAEAFFEESSKTGKNVFKSGDFHFFLEILKDKAAEKLKKTVIGSFVDDEIKDMKINEKEIAEGILFSDKIKGGFETIKKAVRDSFKDKKTFNKGEISLDEYKNVLERIILNGIEDYYYTTDKTEYIKILKKGFINRFLLYK